MPATPTVDALLRANLIWIDDDEFRAIDPDDGVECNLWDAFDRAGLEAALVDGFADSLTEQLPKEEAR